MRILFVRVAAVAAIFTQFLLTQGFFLASAQAQNRAATKTQKGTASGNLNNNRLIPSGAVQNRPKSAANGNAATGFVDATQEKESARSKNIPAFGSTTSGSTAPGSTARGSTAFGANIQGSTAQGSATQGSTKPGASLQGSTTAGASRPTIQNKNPLGSLGINLSGAAGNARNVRSQTKISVDFPGGTIGEYVDVVKKEADSINLIVTESAKELKLPKIALKNVPVHVAVKCIEQCFDPNKTIVRVGGEVEGVQFIQAEIVSTNQVEVINVRHLISGTKNDKEKENFLAAVETGLQMQSETTTKLKIKFHEETGLLFLSGDRSEISLVQQIVSELSPKYVGGMSGSSGGMMGTGGFGMGASGGDMSSGMEMTPRRNPSGAMSGFRGGPSGAGMNPGADSPGPGFRRGNPSNRGGIPGAGRTPSGSGDAFDEGSGSRNRTGRTPSAGGADAGVGFGDSPARKPSKTYSNNRYSGDKQSSRDNGSDSFTPARPKNKKSRSSQRNSGDSFDEANSEAGESASTKTDFTNDDPFDN